MMLSVIPDPLTLVIDNQGDIQVGAPVTWIILQAEAQSRQDLSRDESHDDDAP